MEVICMNIRNDTMAETFPPRSTSSFRSSIFTSSTLLLRHLITFYQVEISRNFNRKMNGSQYLLVELTVQIERRNIPFLTSSQS